MKAVCPSVQALLGEDNESGDDDKYLFGNNDMEDDAGPTLPTPSSSSASSGATLPYAANLLTTMAHVHTLNELFRVMPDFSHNAS